MSNDKLSWEALAEQRGIFKKGTPTENKKDNFSSEDILKQIAEIEELEQSNPEQDQPAPPAQLSREKQQKVENIRQTQGMAFPDVLDFSPNGLSENMKEQISSYLQRPIWYVESPTWLTPPNGDESLQSFAEHQIRTADITKEGWENYTILALPSGGGLSAALVAEVKKQHDVFPIIAFFYQPDPIGEPGFWELAECEDLNK